MSWWDVIFERRHSRIVMEEHLGRKLETFEYVHHINEDESDNRIENLQVVSPQEHRRIHGSRNNPNAGKYIRTEEMRKKASEKASRHNVSLETREKMRKARLGKSFPRWQTW